MFFLGALSIFLLIPTAREYNRSKKIDKEIQALQEEAERINDSNVYLKKRIEYLKSDDYKRKVAKDRLNLRELGEKVVYIQPIISDKAEEKTQKNNYSNNQKGENANNFIKWYNFLFSK